MKEAIGGILLAIGELMVVGKGVLKRLGIDMGEGTAESMRDAGRRMVKEAKQAGADTWSVMKESYGEIFTGTAEHQETMTDAATAGQGQRNKLTREALQVLALLERDAGDEKVRLTGGQIKILRQVEAEAGAGRIKLTKEQYTALQTALKEHAKAQEKLAKENEKNLSDLRTLAGKSQLELLTAQHKAYLEIESQFRSKMAGMTREQQTEAEALLKQTHANQLLAQVGFNEAFFASWQQLSANTRTQVELVAMPAVTDFNEVLKKHGKVLDDNERKTLAGKVRWAEFKEEAADVAFTIADGATALLGFMDALGLSDEKMQTLVTSVGDLAEGIGRIASGDLVGGIIQGVGAIKNALGGLFGKSEAEKKLEQALDKNRNRLEELTREVGNLNFNLSGKQVSSTQAALKEFFATGGASQKGWGERLGRSLLSKGGSMSDLEEVAKTLNIELRPNGHLDPAMLRQLMEATGLVELSQFSNNFQGKRDELEHQSAVHAWTPAEQAAHIAKLLADESPAFAAALQGIDLSTADGQAAAVAALQKLDDDRRAGRVSNAALGGLTGGQFTSEMEGLLDLIRSLT
ncbi:MAG: hypothetical protein HOP28_09375, partial [Gemmatimonadales bacterium]|nr:hypothetical protein [Gemmatimonadales bacterium]